MTKTVIKLISIAVLSLGIAPAEARIYQNDNVVCDGALFWARGQTNPPAAQDWSFDYETKCYVNVTLTSTGEERDGSSIGNVAIRVKSVGACEGEGCRSVDADFTGSYRRRKKSNGANLELFLGPIKKFSQATFIDPLYSGMKAFVTDIPYGSPYTLFVEGDGGIQE